ncbi:thermonuclease family protein [Pseudomonas rhizosphaerae]|uniref:thermonuclease family protein n=1 Tax=Pseudomonas rhizosphaerae TaxID=216142 RepID=UPI003B50A16C
MGAFFVGVFWLGIAQAQVYCPAPGGLDTAQVRQVIDGDTLRLQDGRSVRMIGINAPEIGRQGRDDEPYAVAARRRLQALVDDSDGLVGLQLGRESKDRYQRTLAHVYGRGGVNFEAQLLTDGLALQVAVAPNVEQVACQQLAERAARKAGLGLWRQSPAIAAAQVERAGFALLGGRVSKVERNRAGAWIELDDSVVLHVAPKVFEQFPEGWLDSLEGRQVEARGWVLDRSRRGKQSAGQLRWMLPVSDPAMVQMRP